MKSKNIRLAIEIIAWVFFIIFPAFVFSTIQSALPNGHLNPALSGIIIAHLLLIVFYYFNYYYAIPKYYFKKNYKMYTLILIFCLVCIILILETNKEFSPFYKTSVNYGHLLFLISIKIRFLMVFLLALGVTSYNRLRQAEEEKLKSELSYLKAQINPHFLFNTLNSIYALTVKKSEIAPEAVTKLSAIMRYVISEAKQDFVSLDKEMNYVSSYVELEKLRLTPKVDLKYSVEGEMPGKQIAPLILIPFIENAFKYGVSTSEDSEIAINISVKNNELKLQVKNKIAVNKSPSKESTRLGIETTQKRLDLLYPAKHVLTIKNSENYFTVNLTMKLA